MPISLEHFERSLSDSGLLSADEVHQFRRQTKPPPTTADDFATALVGAKKLTSFQAQCIAEGKADGLVFDEYVIVDKIGAGGMGDVYKARHRSMDRLVAVKVISSKAVDSPEAVQRFHREVKAAAQLEHPNIVSAYDAREVGGQHYLIMQLVVGHDLSSIVRQSGPLSVEQAIECILQAARGLEYAHKRGIIHRDIKPSNILLREEDGRVKILDMGLARLQGSDEVSDELTHSGQIMGTVDYMPPEQAEDTHQADEQSDIYALGCTLYRVLTGKPPYQGKTEMQKLLAHREQPIPSIGELRPDVPHEVEAIYRQMVAKKPADRQASMTVVIQQLEACMQPAATSSSSVGEPSDTELAEFVQQFKRDESTATAAGDSHTVRNSQFDTDTTGSVAATPPPQQPSAAPKPAPKKIGPLAAREKRQSRQERQQVLFAIGGGAVCVVLLLGAAFWLFGAEPQGTLVVEGPLDKVQLSAKAEDWQDFRPIEPDDNGRIKLAPGKYELSLQGDYKVEPASIEIVDGKESEVRLVAKTPPTPPSVREYALDFDGESSYVKIDSLMKIPTDGFTLEVWIRRREQIAGNGYVIAFAPGGASILLKIGASREICTFAVKTVDDEKVPIYSNRIPEDVPVHVAGCFDGEQMRLYVNGKRQKEMALVEQRLSDEFRPLFIGRNNDLGGYRGVIDEIRISSVARYSEDFIPEKRFNSDKNTLALYRFDEGQGDVVTDSSGNGHHGTIHNATWVRADGTPLKEPPKDFALEFDGNGHVDLKSTLLDASIATTVEAWVVAYRTERGAHIVDGPMSICVQPGQRKWQMVFRTEEKHRSFMTPEQDVLNLDTHVAAVADNNGWVTLFVNGVKQWKGNKVNALAYNDDWGIGVKSHHGVSLMGRVNEVRISNIARYDKDFTPAKRFEPDKHTLALYHFDEGTGDKVLDSSGNNHHGKIHGNVKWVGADGTATQKPQKDYALSFDGKSVVHVPLIKQMSPKQRTIEAWVRANIPNQHSKKVLAIEKPYLHLGLHKRGKKEQPGIHFKSDGQSQSAESQREISADEWQHLAAVWDGEHAQLFLGGQLQSLYGEGQQYGNAIALSLPGNPEYVESGLLIGAGSLQSIKFGFTGLIDEVRVSSVARYDKDFEPAKRFEKDDDTIALYHFDSSQGDKLIDSSGNHHHGIIKGAKWVKVEASDDDN